MFINKFRANTQMQRTHGRASSGERVVAKVPHGRWKTISTVAALTTWGVLCSASFDGTDTDTFTLFVADTLVPSLRPGRVVVMDNLAPHKSPRVRKLMEGAGCRLLLLRPYSPDYDQIYKAKTALQAMACREVGLLFDAIGVAWRSVTRRDAVAFMRHCG